MHKGAILDVHSVRSLRIAIHACLAAGETRRGARHVPAGGEAHRYLAATRRLTGWLVMVRTIWPSVLRRPMVSGGYSGLKPSPGSGLIAGCSKPHTHEYSQSLDRRLGRAVADSAICERIERIASSTNEARYVARVSVEIKASNQIKTEN
jgi:hypothetical protein